MSYDLSIYSTSDQLAALEDLKSQMENEGWVVVFTAGLRDDTILPLQGAVKDGMIIYGWQATDEYAALFGNLVAVGNIRGLFTPPRAAQGLVVASCELSCWLPYNIHNDWDEEEIAELEAFDKRYVAALRRAKSSYNIRAGKSLPSIPFSRDVWHIIGNLVGGLLEGAQKGTRKFITAQHQHGEQRLPARLWSRIGNLVKKGIDNHK